MSTSKYMDRICIIALVIALVISVLFMNGAALGIQVQAAPMGYEEKLFDTSKVHTIDILIDDWDAFLATARSEEYSICDVVIDGEAVPNVGIRGKGNTSLSTVTSMDSDRYSFKIEFDQYDSAKSYYGLDKLSLNNLIQDNTMMKDYLTYQMMNEFGVAAPLSSFVYITVNGEDWGLYLAVEAVEESFLQRNYGSDYGDLYKPDSMDMGGGRGNGKDFSFEDFMAESETQPTADAAMPSMPGDIQGGQMMPGMQGGFDPSQMGGMAPGQPGSFDPSQAEGMVPGQGGMQGGFDPSQIGGMMPGGNGESFEQPTMPENFDPTQMQGMMPGGNMGGMDSGGTRLQYIDDQISSYAVIFDNAKTDVTAADQQRMIRALKSLSAGEDLESVVAVEDVIRYFVVHNFVVNGDSYTGSMIHNYYLYEQNGQLSMIPWDYNLAFGTFHGGSASAMISDDIDSPLSVTGCDRPMIDWIFGSEEYTTLYHSYFQEFLDTVDAAEIITKAKALIAPYVEKDPTKFCTYEEFEKAVETLHTFCALRSQSVADQLAGGDGMVDTAGINLSDMGTMNHSIGGNGQTPEQPGSATGETQQFPGGAGMESPGGMGNMRPGQNDMTQENFPNREHESMPQGGNQLMVFCLTAVILAAGLVFVRRYRR